MPGSPPIVPMDPAGPPMILPKGIVVNTTNVYEEVADHAILPIDKICEYWHVYTTTNQRLKDPTARRLENFWWHVWGSDRRFLSGKALAKLYEDISVGPTFVPLRGPANRWEGPELPPMIRHAISADERDAPISRPAPDHVPSKTTTSETSLKILSSSASKPPPTHPILKKARGPSASGPRPTARFLSPHESAEEDGEAETPSSGSTANTGLEMRPSTASTASTASPAKKKGSAATKKFVASSATARRRPILPPRKGSSQLSVTTDPPPRDGGSSTGSQSSGSQHLISPVADRSPGNAAAGEQGSSGMTPQGRPLSAKAAGKRPATQRVPPAQLKALSTLSTPRANTSNGAALPQARSMISLSGNFKPSNRSSMPPTVSSPLASGQGIEIPTMMARSQSHTGYEGYRQNSIGRAPNHGLFTGATASMTNVAAQGTIIDQSGVGSMPTPSMFERHQQEFSLPSRSSTTSLLTPTQPSTSVNVPLGRTRSQLTLVLEREKARLGDKIKPRG